MSCGSTACITTEVSISRPEPAGKMGQAGLNPLIRWIAAAKQMYRRRRQRQALLELDDDRLADIGLSRQQVEQEGRKPFWE
jgi:uncharacterized protein YjiS (DUF1127 family)